VTERILEIHAGHRCVYGSPRIHARRRLRRLQLPDCELAMVDHMRSELVVGALEMALATRAPTYHPGEHPHTRPM
jgi:hypothetical protein